MTNPSDGEDAHPVPPEGGVVPPALPERPAGSPPRNPPHRRRSFAIGAALVAACGVGVGAGALAAHEHGPAVLMLTPAPIGAMADNSPVAIKGQVAEVFGNKFILADASGRALVETGPAGEDKSIALKNETVTVQGRFEHGFVHAIAFQHADGMTVVLAPPGPPPPPHGPIS